MIGGYVDEEPTSNVWRFSPSDGSWEALTSLPSARGAPAAATYRRKIYVVGDLRRARGRGSDRRPLDLRHRRRLWTSGPDMPTARHHHGAAPANGRLVVLGGRNDDDLSIASSSVSIRTTGEWTTLASLPQGAGGLGTAAVGDRSLPWAAATTTSNG